MNKCPYCGGGSYYTKDYAHGACRGYRNFDGSEPDYSEYHSNLQYKIGKIAYCTDCHKPLGNINKIEGGME